jgi:hypothetical protein
MRVGLSVAAKGGEGGGKSEGSDCSSNGFGLGHGRLHSGKFKAAVMAAYR